LANLALGVPVATLATTLFPGETEQIAIAAASTAATIDIALIKAVDANGGSNGVCLYQFWVGPLFWLRPQLKE